MKKSVLLLFIASFIVSCCKDPKPEPEEPPYQDYTSFVVWHNADDIAVLYDCVAGYADSTGYWHKLGDLGTIVMGVYSNEVVVDSTFDLANGIFIFSPIESGWKLDTTYFLKPNIKNIFQINRQGFHAFNVDMYDHYQYPF